MILDPHDYYFLICVKNADQITDFSQQKELLKGFFILSPQTHNFSDFPDLFASIQKLQGAGLLSIRSSQDFFSFETLFFNTFTVSTTAKKQIENEKNHEIANFLFNTILKTTANPSPLDKSAQKKILNHFNNFEKKIQLFDKAASQQSSKYEFRLFFDVYSENKIFSLWPDWFAMGGFTSKASTDYYVCGDPEINMKIRKKSLQIKKLNRSLEGMLTGVDAFFLKQKIPYPVTISFFDHLGKGGGAHHQAIGDEETQSSCFLYSKQDVIDYIHNIAPQALIKVQKKRYKTSIDHMTKLEFSMIQIAEKKWLSLCLESKDPTTVLLMRMFFSQKNATALNYITFLQQYKDGVD